MLNVVVPECVGKRRAAHSLSDASKAPKKERPCIALISGDPHYRSGTTLYNFEREGSGVEPEEENMLEDLDIGHHYQSKHDAGSRLIEAWLWDGDWVHTAPDFIMDLITTGQIMDTFYRQHDVALRSFHVLTVCGTRKIQDGEWLVQYGPDLLYIVDHDRFAKNYKAVNP